MPPPMYITPAEAAGTEVIFCRYAVLSSNRKMTVSTHSCTHLPVSLRHFQRDALALGKQHPQEQSSKWPAGYMIGLCRVNPRSEKLVTGCLPPTSTSSESTEQPSSPRLGWKQMQGWHLYLRFPAILLQSAHSLGVASSRKAMSCINVIHAQETQELEKTEKISRCKSPGLLSYIRMSDM